MRRIACAVLLLLLAGPSAAAPQGAQWTAAPRRERVELSVPEATLRGWDYAGGGGLLTLVVFDDVRPRLARRDAVLRALAAGGPRVIAYDYRGSGLSRGHPGLERFRADALRIVDDAAARSGGTQHVAVLGFSLGSIVAADVASRRNVAALLLLAPIRTVGELIRLELGQVLPAKTDAQDLGVANLVRRSPAPLLVIAGAADADVAPSYAADVLAASNAHVKLLVTIPGAAHRGLLERQQTRDAILAFLAPLT